MLSVVIFYCTAVDYVSFVFGLFSFIGDSKLTLYFLRKSFKFIQHNDKNFARTLPEAVVWHKYLNISMMSNFEGNCELYDINNEA